MSFASLTSWFAQVMQGGTFEIILLIVLVIVALIVLLVLIWLLWKLLVLLGKGLLWLANWGSDRYSTWSQEKREERLAAPPLVAVGWGGSETNIGLRRAFAQARGLVGPDAAVIVVVAGDGFSDLCRSLGLTPPGLGVFGIAAAGNSILIDASKADNKGLRRLARVLPWRRPVDGMVTLVGPEGVPPESVVRTAIFARQTSMKIALHLVLPSTSKTAAWQIIDAQNRDGDTICAQLAADAMRTWLAGGSREGMVQLALAQSRELPAAVDRTMVVAPTSVVDVTSLSFGGAGLRAAVAQTVERTRPESVLGYSVWVGLAAFALGACLTVLTVYHGLARSADLHAVVDSASREAAVPWSAADINTIPSAAKIRRITGLSNSLTEHGGFSFLMPLASLAPNSSAPNSLAAAFLTGYVLRPLADVLDAKIKVILEPTDTPDVWIEQARIVDEWFAAWDNLSDDPREVDLRRLFVDAFGGTSASWAEGTDLALLRSDAKPPPPGLGGLDIDMLTDLARENFVLTMQTWADKVYTNGPVATAARQASDHSAGWREQYNALVALRDALKDPSQQWLTAAEDRSDNLFELLVLGRALGLDLFSEGVVLRAKAAVSRVRVDARQAVAYFAIPGIGPILTRLGSGAGGGSGPAVGMTKEASTWLTFLDRVANAGFTDLPKAVARLPVGPVTVDTVVVSEARNKLRIFDQFASDLPTGLPPVVAQKLIRELTSELVVGITLATEQSLRNVSVAGVASEQAERLAQIVPAMQDLTEIEEWLRTRHADAEARRAVVVRARAAEAVLIASADVLVEEDPVGVYPDPAADGNALLRRFERGVDRLGRIFEQYASPFIESAALGSGWAALEWRSMQRDIDGYERGDVQSVLSGLEGMIRAYAEDPAKACKSPRTALSGRDDYIARSLVRFRSELAHACLKADMAAAEIAYQKIIKFFDRNVRWLWPYAGDAEATEITPTALAKFVGQVKDSARVLSRLNKPFAQDLLDTAEFWSLDQNNNAVVKFHIDWRTVRAEERLAEHVIAFDIEGAESDENGNYIWRYGAPLKIIIKLAQNSPYRFFQRGGSSSLEAVLTSTGNGTWLRVFEGLSNGAISFAADVRLAPTQKQSRRKKQKPFKTYPLLIMARVTHADGKPMYLPAFSRHAGYQLDLSDRGE